MTARKTVLLGFLGLLIAIDIGVACSSSTDTTLPPPPGTASTTSSSGSSSSSSGTGGASGAVDLCGVAINLGQAECTLCNTMTIQTNGACVGPETACKASVPCIGDTSCIGGCLMADSGALEFSCVTACLKAASLDFTTYLTCIGEHCPACLAQNTECDLSDAGVMEAGMEAGMEGGACMAETDVGCGGPNCVACAAGKMCMVPSDCTSGVCTTGKCVAPTCSDGVQNEGETDIDCGGQSCPACSPGKKCDIKTDCTSLVCSGGLCQPPSCSDGVKNGTESDVDCGGTCAACNPGEKCNNPSDCKGMNCVGGICQCPVGMIVSPILTGGIYCIDAVEVTYSEYQTFYAANPPTDTQDAWCSWNTSWTPTAEWPAPQALQFYPVSYVNWCQASRYCQYSGKRLCGQINGTSVATTDAVNVAKDEWYNACTAQNANTYPYGNTYNPLLCNDQSTFDGGSPGPWSQVQVMSCLGGVPGLYDMSGNVAEWEDSCTAMAGPSDQCLTRGGSFLSTTAAQMACTAAAPAARNYAGPDVGFRCCL